MDSIARVGAVVIGLELLIVAIALFLAFAHVRWVHDVGVKRGEGSWQAYCFAFIIATGLVYAVVGSSQLGATPKGLLHSGNLAVLFYCIFLNPLARNRIVKAKNWLRTEVEAS